MIAFQGRKPEVPGTTFAATQPVAAIRQNPKEPVRQLSLMRWGTIMAFVGHISTVARWSHSPSTDQDVGWL